MPSHNSAEKAVRKTLKRTAINKNRISRVRTFIKHLESKVKLGDKVSAQDYFKTAQSEIMRGVTKGVLKKNTAARKVSKLALKIKSIA